MKLVIFIFFFFPIPLDFNHSNFFIFTEDGHINKRSTSFFIFNNTSVRRERKVYLHTQILKNNSSNF
jgi:hypothetical protein